MCASALCECTGCLRHFREAEPLCPFCGYSRGRAKRRSLERELLSCQVLGSGTWQSTLRARTFAALGAVAMGGGGAAALACSAYGGPPIIPMEAPLPDGGVAVSGHCSDGEYVAFPVDQFHVPEQSSPCSFLACAERTSCDGETLTTFAICVEGSFSVCSCVPPEAGVELLADGGRAPDCDGGLDACKCAQ